MSQFSFDDLKAMGMSASHFNNASSKSSAKVGFFKLADNGDEALVRFDVASTSDLDFAAVHQLGADTRWMKVACLNAKGDLKCTCPLCNAVAAGNKAIGKAQKKVYVRMLASYKDPTTGGYSVAVPVVWERPAKTDFNGNPQGFLAKIINLLKDFGDLKNYVFKVTRNGAAGDMKTDYDITYIPTYNKPECVPTDFSAFDNFHINKHSYWEKSEDDINTFLTTGKFPDVIKADSSFAERTVSAPVTSTVASTGANTVTIASTPASVTPTAAVSAVEPTTESAPAAAPAAAPAISRKFSGFDF